jgi:hypothetical protein
MGCKSVLHIGTSALVAFILVLILSDSSFAAKQSSAIPDWLQQHVGLGDGQIAETVLQRSRALYLQKTSKGKVKNPCYFAMDATRPHNTGRNSLGRRFYIICEAKKSFHAIPAGHGGGRNLRGIANFTNGLRCIKNFSNALDSKLTDGGSYITAETKTSFKGYYRSSKKRKSTLHRTFIQFDGQGETANAREREIGGHAAVLLRGMCRLKDPKSRHADPDGYVYLGNLVNYAGGRSSGCTTWSTTDTKKIISMVKNNPTTLYIYPEADDIEAVVKFKKQTGKKSSQTKPYWNASCLKQIKTPKFWPKKTLEPLLKRYKKDHPVAAPQPVPLCKGQ